MQQFISILAFYRPFVLWSFIINIAIVVVYPHIMPAIVTKLLLAVFVWFLVQQTEARRKLVLYARLGISALKIFSISFAIDILITVSFITLIKEYI